MKNHALPVLPITEAPLDDETDDDPLAPARGILNAIGIMIVVIVVLYAILA